MQHLLLTRYNVVTESALKEGVSGLDADWLAHRDNLFRRYCVPSIEAQTNKDFRWIVFFHPATSRRYYSFLDGTATVILANTTSEGLAVVRRDIVSGSPVLSSRIDNDDILATGFIDEVQRLAHRSLADADGRDFAVMPSRGAFVHLPSGRWKPALYPNCPFVSLVEFCSPDKRWVSPLGINHTHAGRLYPVKEIAVEAPLWAQLIHERNLGNLLHWERPGPPVQPLESLPDNLAIARSVVTAAGVGP